MKPGQNLVIYRFFMKKIIVKNKEFWYRQEEENLFILFEKSNYYYLVTGLIIFVLEELSKNKDLSEITDEIKQKYNIDVSVEFLLEKLSEIEGLTIC